MKKRFVVQMLRTSRCLNGVSSNAVRKCRSVPRRAHRQKVSTRPASLSRRTSGVTNEQIIGSPVDVDISPLACQQGFKTDTEYKQGVQNGVHSQLDDVLEQYSKGYCSTLLYKRNDGSSHRALLSLSPATHPNPSRRMFSATPPKAQEKVKLRDKILPVFKAAPASLRAGWRSYTGDIDMTKYEKLHWSMTPFKKVMFSYFVSVKMKNSLKGAIVHTWSSLKLFALNSKIGIKIGWRILKGEQVSIIERNRLRRALSDIFLMMPFSVFIIIPGAELLIPLYVKLFPSAMPKAFESLNQKQQRQIKQAQTRLDLASFLHETLNEVQKKQKALENPTMVEFMKFTKEVRLGHRWVSNQDFKKFAPLFQEELTIDKMDRRTLDALCRIFKANPVKHRVVGAHGEFTQSTQLIRILLKKRIHDLKYEDQEYISMIATSGMKSIPDEDLQDLSRDRGMRAIGLTRERLVQQYTDWIELSNDPKISDSMLAYTRMLYMPKAVPQMADAMERAIQDKKPKPVGKAAEKTADTLKQPDTLTSDQIIDEPDSVDTAPSIVNPDTMQFGGERQRLSDRIEKMKISLKDIEAILEAIMETKRVLKPLAATQDDLNQKINEIDHDLEDDRVELLNPAIVKKIENIAMHAAKQVQKIPIEESDVAVQCTLMSDELRKRNMTEYKIKRMIRVMDLDSDGLISLDELEHYMKDIQEYIQASKDDSVDCTKIINLLSSSSKPSVPPIPVTSDNPQPVTTKTDKSSDERPSA